MRGIYITTLMLLAVGGAVQLRAQDAAVPSRTPLIVSSAHGEVKAPPDQATITLSIQTRAGSAAQAASENAHKQSAVLAALDSAGVRDSQISTQNYSIVPETRYDKQGQVPRIVSYLVVNSISVETGTSARLGALIDAALSAGANQVSSVDFTVSNSQQLYQRAVAVAVENAQAQAQAMAAAAGGHLGSLVEMVSNDAGWTRPAPLAFRGVAMAAAETPIIAGPRTVSASVTGRWIFLPSH
jgi:uncharacterized protein